jgi:magnesium transporter
MIKMPRKEQLISEGIKWIDLLEPTNTEMQEISEQFGLNPHTVKDCMEPEHLPKYELDEQTHFLILRFYAHNFNSTMATIQEITNKLAIFFCDSFIITIHVSPVSFLDVLRKKYVDPKKCFSTSDLITRIVWNALETFNNPVNRLSEQIDFYENQLILRKNNTDQTEALYFIKRQASISHKILVLMQEPINHLYAKTGEESALQDVKDQYLKMQTLYNQVLDDVTNLTNLHLSFASQRTNEVMKILTIFSVFFMPLTFIVGVYGMNFEFMPELRQKWAYPAILVIMAFVTAVVYLWFRRKKWL